MTRRKPKNELEFLRGTHLVRKGKGIPDTELEKWNKEWALPKDLDKQLDERFERMRKDRELEHKRLFVREYNEPRRQFLSELLEEDRLWLADWYGLLSRSDDLCAWLADIGEEEFQPSQAALDKFWQRVDRKGIRDEVVDCWLWNGGYVTRYHYPAFAEMVQGGGRVQWLAARFAWALVFRYKLPKNILLISRDCIPGPCINPRHHYICEADEQHLVRSIIYYGDPEAMKGR